MTSTTAEPAPSMAARLWAWAGPRGDIRPWALRLGVGLLVVAAFLSAPLWLGPADQYTAGLAVIAVLLAVSYNLLLGTTGMVSFGHAAFYGIGAFTVALVATRVHADATMGLLMAPLIGAIAGLVVGAFCLRAVRLYFALLTLAVSQLLYVAAFEADTITGGDNGIHGIPVPSFLNDPSTAYYFVLGVVLVGVAVVLVLTRSPFGAALTAIRENRQRAAFIGLTVKAYELAAFTISASLAATAGALYGIYDQQAYPGLMFWTESGTPVVMVLIGGMRAFLGPIIGGVFYTFLASKVQNTTIYWDLIIGAILLLIVLVLPEGLAGAPRRLRALLSGRRSAPVAPGSNPLAAVAAAGPPLTGSERAAASLPADAQAPAVARAAEAGAPLLVVRGLRKSFGGLNAVDGVDLEVREGAVHAVIGPNGAGKSTMFNLVSGHIRPDAGSVSFEGRDVTGAAPQRLAHAGVGRAFQTTAVFSGLSVADNVRLAIMAIRGDTHRPIGLASSRHHALVDETLANVGLSDHARTRAGDLSHGDQRALELAISLAVGARLLLLDEPTAGMSPYETRRTLELLRRLTADRQVTLLITEHDMEVVFGIAETVTVMADGRVLAEGTPSEVRANPDVVRVYLGSDA